MAPYRVRGQAEDSRSDSSSLKDKLLAAPPAPTTAKGRRNTSNTGSNLKDVTAASAVTDSPKGGSDASSGGLEWTSFPTSTLHRYRHAHHLQIPSAFISSRNHAILSRRGPGQFSPTMARPKDKRRIGKESLALAVRKDFSAAAVSEQEVVTAFLYTVRNQEKQFRMRFAAGKAR